MDNPRTRHWSRASHAAENGAKRKFIAAIIELVLETFICKNLYILLISG